MSTRSAFARGLLAFAASGLMAAPALAQIDTTTSSGATHQAVDAESLDPRTVPEWVIEPMGAWGGPVHAFEKHGDIGYVGSGQRLVILDMSDLTDIKELGTVKLGSTVQDFKVRDGLAYVATIRVNGGTREEMGIRHSGFHVVDVSNVNAPEVIWSDLANERFIEVDLWGDIAFVREYDGTMWAADLTNPLAPVMRSTNGIQFRNTAGTVMRLNDLEIHGDLAYMAVQESLHQFQIFDLSTITPGVWPAMPQRLGTANFFIQREARKVAVEGDWAYVLGRDDFVLAGIQDEAPEEIIWAVNVSNPAVPTKHGNFSGFISEIPRSVTPVYDICAIHGRLYVANGLTLPFLDRWDGPMGLVVLDVATDPGQPTLIGSHRTHGSVRDVIADEQSLYLLDEGEGLIVMDATNPNDITRVGGYHSPSRIVAMARDGDLLYAADAWNGLSVLDVSNLSKPVLVGVYQAAERMGMHITGLALDSDGYAYLAAGYAGLEVIDVSDPADPFLRGAIRLPTDQWQTVGPVVQETLTDGSGKFAYLSILVPGAGYRMFSIDIGNPAHPTQASPSPPPISSPNSFARYDTGRYLTANGSTVIQDFNGVPASTPVVTVLPLELAHNYTSVAYNDATEIVSATYGSQSDGTWFVTYDVNDVAEGSELAAVPMHRQGAVAAHPQGAFVLGQWVQNDPNRVTLLDLSDPSQPNELASAPLAFGQSVAGDGPVASILSGASSIVVAEDSLGEDSLVGLEAFRIRQTADRNADGVVNPLDFSAFLVELQQGERSADLNGDGMVTAADLNEFLLLYRAQAKTSIAR